jgi:hypothetical protein
VRPRQRAGGRQLVKRAERVLESGGGQALAPERRRAARDLLQRDEVGVQRAERGRLLVQPRDAAGDVPGDEAAQ